MKLERKTLMLKKTDEFYGPLSSRYGDTWFTSSSPFDLYGMETTMETIKENWPERNFDGVILVTLKMEVKY